MTDYFLNEIKEMAKKWETIYKKKEKICEY